MTPRRARAWSWFGAIFCFAAFWAGAPWSDMYVASYGSFLPSRGELALKLHLLVFILPATILLAFAWSDMPRNRRNALAWFDALDKREPGYLWPTAAAIIVLTATAVIRAQVLHFMPLTDDEHVYLFQAKILASGRLFADSLPEPVRPFFDNQFIVNNGRWFGLYFFGHPAILAAAMKAGLVEWAGGICAALTVLLTAAIARRVFDERVAILAVLLLMLSPFFLLVSSTQLSQPTAALFLTLLIYATLRIEDSPRQAGWWIVAALTLCAGVFIRPQTGAVLSLPVSMRIVYLMAKGRIQPGWLPPVAAAIICLAGATTFLGINNVLTGDPFRTGYHAYLDQGIHWLTPFGPFYTLREISQNLSQVNFWLFGWPVSLAFAPFFHQSARSKCLGAVFILAVLSYGIAAVPNITSVGPVYYAETIAPLVMLSASGFTSAVQFVRARTGDSRLLSMLLLWPRAAILGALVTFLPAQLFSLSLMAAVAREPYALVEARGLHRAVVFVTSLPSTHRQPRSWAYFHRNNSPDLSDSVLFVKDLGPDRNRLLIDYLPQREPYRMWMDGDRLRLEPIPH